MNNPYAHAAQLYRSLGWQGVLPVVGKDEDLPFGFTGRHDRWPTDDEVERWISERGSHNIALRVPQNILGIDIDAYDGRNGLRTIEHFEERYGPLPPTWKSSSRTDGSGILFYRVPTGVQWVSDLGRESDVQIVRWGHRYAVVWPSVHPRTNQLYRWWLPLASAEAPEPPELNNLTELPEAWVNGLRKPRGGVARDVIAGVSTPDGDPNAEEVHLDPGSILRGVAPGEQNDVLFKYVCSLRSRKLKRPEMITLTWAAMQASINSRPEDPWMPTHAIDMVDRVMRDYPEGTSEEQMMTRVMAWAAPAQATVPVVQQVARVEEPATVEVADAPLPAADVPDVETVEGIVEGPPDGPEDLSDRPERDPVEPPTDLGNARRMVRLFHGHLRYIPELDQWHYWDGKRWHLDTRKRNHVLECTAQVVNLIRSQADVEDDADARRELVTHWKKTQSSTVRKAMMDAAEAEPEFRVSNGKLDAIPELLACANATIELSEECWKARENSPHDPLLFNTNTEFDSLARSADWDAFVAHVHPDPEVRRYMQALNGYSLLGANPMRLWVILKGTTGTGKSNMLTLIDEALGDYSKAAPNSLFRDNQDERPRADLYDALRVRRIHTSELSSEFYMHADQIKRLTGGDVLTARLPHSAVTLRCVPAFTPFAAMNEMPTITAADLALRERMVVVPFDNPIKSSPAVDQAVGRLRAQPPTSAILNYLLEGWNLYRQGALKNQPAAVTELTQKSFEELNEFDHFLNECFDYHPDYWDSSDRMFKLYQAWCDKASISRSHRLTTTAFGKALRRKGIQKQERVRMYYADGTYKQGTRYSGLRINEEIGQEIMTFTWIDLMNKSQF